MNAAAYVEDFKKARPATGSPVLCHAPFKSIYFGMGGKLFTCCFNKVYHLGLYPQQSIHDIWFGERAQAFRKTIKNDDLSWGCQGCGHLLAGRNYEGVPIKNFDYLAWDDAGYPTKMDFELSNTCNLECVMCRGELSSSIRQNREKKPPITSPYDAAFISQLDEFIPHLENSHFLGGEPFLIPQYLDIWDRMIELNPRISISVQTNGTVFNERIQRILERMPFSISVSIDSIEKERYEQIRVNARFERVMENLRFFKEHCERKGRKLTISYCPMPQNWRELPRVVEFCNSLGVDVFFNTVTLPVKYALNHLPSTELEEMLNLLGTARLPEATAVERFNKNSLNGVKNQVSYWLQQALHNERVLNGSGPAGSLSHFFARVEKYITSLDGKSAAEKAAMVAAIQEKIGYMLQCAEDEGFYKEAEAYICGLDAAIVTDFVPGSEKDVLYGLLKSYMGT